MPVTPLPLFIGTTLAVIGSGYVFKKFVYDPHLAPIIEALIAAAHGEAPRPVPISHRSHSNQQRHSIPIPAASSTASSTARRYHQTHARRRSGINSRGGRGAHEDDSELDEGLLRRRLNGDHGYHLAAGSEERDEWGRPSRDLGERYHSSQDDIYAPRPLIEPYPHLSKPPCRDYGQHPPALTPLYHPQPIRRKGSDISPLVDFDVSFPGPENFTVPPSPEILEIHDVVFDYNLMEGEETMPDCGKRPPNNKSTEENRDTFNLGETPPNLQPILQTSVVSSKSDSAPAFDPSLVLPPRKHDHEIQLSNVQPPPSSTFSFLSLSRPSSPELAGHPVLVESSLLSSIDPTRMEIMFLDEDEVDHTLGHLSSPSPQTHSNLSEEASIPAIDMMYVDISDDPFSVPMDDIAVIDVTEIGMEHNEWADVQRPADFWDFRGTPDRNAPHTVAPTFSRDPDDDDLISSASFSTYEDAEIYSPSPLSRALSPVDTRINGRTRSPSEQLWFPGGGGPQASLLHQALEANILSNSGWDYRMFRNTDETNEHDIGEGDWDTISQSGRP